MDAGDRGLIKIFLYMRAVGAFISLVQAKLQALIDEHHNKYISEEDIKSNKKRHFKLESPLVSYIFCSLSVTLFVYGFIFEPESLSKAAIKR